MYALPETKKRRKIRVVKTREKLKPLTEANISFITACVALGVATIAFFENGKCCKN
jgi:hypothetical protein